MPSSDRYYGFEDQAVLCEHVITRLFASGPAATPTSSVTSVSPVASTSSAVSGSHAQVVSPAPTSGSIGVGQPGIDTPPHSPKPSSTSSSSSSSVVSASNASPAAPNLGEFIAYALYRTRLPVSITHQALLLLGRLKARYPSARGTSTSPHRLFLSSLMLSSKISMDDTYSNQSWTLVGQNLFTLREVNQMERELFAFLGWNVVVRDEELSQWVADNVAPYEAERALALATRDNTARKSSMEDRKRRRDSGSHAAASSSSASTSSAAAAPASTSPSHSRSPSPDSLRHRRASDAALAILHGAQRSHHSHSHPASSRRGANNSARSSPYTSSSRSSSAHSTTSHSVASATSSATSSPQSQNGDVHGHAYCCVPMSMSSASTSNATTPASTGPNTPHDSNSPVGHGGKQVHPHHHHHQVQREDNGDAAMHVAAW